MQRFNINSEKFCIVASSQANESVNNIMADEAPKNPWYASAISTKNEGDSHIIDVHQKLLLSPEKHTAAFISQLDRTRFKRASKVHISSTKRSRFMLSHKRDELRQKNEESEGIQHQSNCGFLKGTTTSSQNHIVEDSYIDLPNTISSEASIFVYFDFETSGFHNNDEISQIAAQCNDYEFTVYITPTKKINPESSPHTGLKNINGQLHLRHDQVLTVSIENALRVFQEFSTNLKKPCLLVAHNASFDISHLI